MRRRRRRIRSARVRKGFRLNIPVKYHLQLHQLKVLEGRRIHGVIEEALDLWFQKLNGAPEAHAPKE